MSNYLTYAKFNSEGEANDLCSFLDDHKIKFVFEHERDIFDKIIVGESLDQLVLLKLKDNDFEKVGKLIRTEFKVDTTQIDRNYYLFNFSDAELLEVFNSKDEWNYFDVALSKRLLDERNIIIKPSDKNKLHLVKPQNRLEIYVIILEYIFSFLIAYIGIIIGLATLAAKKTLQNGQRVKLYDNWTRRNALIILIIGIIRSLIFPLLSFFSNR